MQESQWQKKKKRKRSQSKSNGFPSQNGAVTSASSASSASKSLLQRLQGVIDRLQSKTHSIDLRNDGPAFVKLATQVVTNEECSLQEGCLASCLVTHLLRRCSHDGQTSTGGKLQMNPQHLLPFAKAIVPRISPAAQLHLPYLAVLSQLMVVHPGVCVSLRCQIEENLLPWLNYPHSAGSRETKSTSRAAVALAGDVWSLLPVASVAGAADDDQAQAGRGTKGAGQRGVRVAAARGAQLQQLMAALEAQLDRLPARALQGAQTSKKTTKEALRIPPIVDHHTAQAPKKFKKSPGQKPSVNLGANETGSTDDISDPVKLVEVLVGRCCNLLVFADRLLRSVASGSNPHGITVPPKHLVLPLIRILQVSPASLQRYATTEVARQALLWPSLHRTALATLATAITTFDHNLALWCAGLQQQLVYTLLAAAPVRNTKQNGGLASDKMADEAAVAELQDIVRLTYKCLSLLMEASRGAVPVDLDLLKAAMRDLTVQPSTLVTLQNLSRKSIANMSIKKKSKNKGYSIVPKNNTPAANDDDAETKAPLSLELSHGIVHYALELLQRVASSPTSHYTLTVDCARILHEELPKVARYFISEWRMFPHSLGEPPVCSSLADEYRHRPARWAGGSTPGGDLCYTSASGRTDLRCFFRGQLLVAELIRLVSSLGTAGTPRLPPHTAQLLHLLHAAQLQLARSHQLRATAQAGTRPLRFLLAHPRVGDFSQTIEDMRAAALSEIAAAASHRVSGDDAGDGSEPSLSGGDDGDASDDDQASLPGGDGDDGSTNDDEEMDEIDENMEDINGNEEEMVENQSEIDGSREELNENGEENKENSIMEESACVDMNGDARKSAEDEDRLHPKRASTDTAVDQKQKNEKKGKSKKKVKGEEKNEKSKEEVKNKKKVKNGKKKKKSEQELKSARKEEELLPDAKTAAESDGAGSSCVLQDGGAGELGNSEECQDDLSVEQMLAELAD